MAIIRRFNGLLVFFLLVFSSLNITIAADSTWDSFDDSYVIPTQNWINHGGNLRNTRHAISETKISRETASNLRLKWKFFSGADVSATPAIYDGILYFPSWNGYIYAVKACDGSLVWKQNLEKLTGIKAPSFLKFVNVNTTVTRSTPTVAGDLLVFGLYGPAVVVAVERLTGKLVWLTQIETHVASYITMSGTYLQGGIYIGTSSIEEGASIAQCCTFRGSLVKLDVQTGKIQWRTYMLPDNFNKTGGYAGSAIWGSSPSIDIKRNLIFIATGNLYSVPPHVRQCQENQNNQTKPSHPDDCLDPDVYSESILALDLDSGYVRWSKQLGGYDVWYVACSLVNFTDTRCPIPGPYPDADFGEAPMMLSAVINGTVTDAVVAVQKSGFAWALDRDRGRLIWTTVRSCFFLIGIHISSLIKHNRFELINWLGSWTCGLGGGGIWGSATDGKRIYTNIANSDAKNFTLKPSDKTTTSGGWVAMDANTGKVLWSLADPNNATVYGPVTIANGVLFGGSTNKEGPIYGINSENGEIIWSYNGGASVYGGASVSNGCIYIGTGYKVSSQFRNPDFTSGTTLFAFCV